MKVVHVSFFYDEHLQGEEELLEQHYTVTGWAEALQRKGAEVVVMNRFSKDSLLKVNNVQYYFVHDQLGATFRSWQLPLKFLKKISALDADIIHLHNFSLSLQTFLLRLLLSRKTAIVIQHHGGKPPGRVKRFFHNLLNSVADGYFFTAIDQGKEWFTRKKQLKKVMSVMEGAAFFNFKKRDAGKDVIYTKPIAQGKTGMKGDPVFIWVGNLIARKDPLTVLEGFVRLFAIYPKANLYMIYSENNLLERVKERISNNGILKDRVHLLGKIPHEAIEMYYHSADYLVAGSFAEGSGYALSEALRCGCVPIVTSIPSFSMMTNGGQLGALWEPGNKDSFVQAALAAASKPLQSESTACINFYIQTLSFDAIAQIAMLHYGNMIKSRARE